MVDPVYQELFCGLHDPAHVVRVAVRLGVAVLLGGILGFERETKGKAAGLRTHMLVSLGAALFILVSLEGGVTPADLVHVVQGLLTGVGFLGGGVILQGKEEDKIKGLTTAATIWVAAAVGTAVGLGWLWLAVFAVLLSWFILVILNRLEYWLAGPDKDRS